MLSGRFKIYLVVLLSSVCALVSGVGIAEGSPWLLGPGSIQLELTSIQQSANSYYLGANKTKLADELELDTTQVALQYGLTEDLMLDFRSGYASSEYSPRSAPSLVFLAAWDSDLEGFAETKIGATWRIKDEFVSGSSLPSVAIRIGYTFAGDYDAKAINSLGDGASGAEVSLLVGKVFNSGFSVLADLGYRNNDNAVPNEWLLSLVASYALSAKLGINLIFQRIESKGSLDISSESFTGQFSAVDEDKEILAVGFSYSINNAAHIALNYGEYVDGRNTPDNDILSLSLGYRF